MLVAGDQVRAGADGGQDRLALGGLAGLAALDLDDLDGTKAQGAAGRRRPLGVVAGEGGFGRSTEAADGDDGDLQLNPPMAARSDRAMRASRASASGPCTDQIFSIW